MHSDEPATCLHDVAYPEGYVHLHCGGGGGGAEEPKPAAKQFPFQLDPFQSEAIRCIENGESVMVSAHTSAGKTVVASYAIAMSLRDNQRVVYTSPIKALGNQKYREFKEEFSDVGLMTGDVTIDPNASCLVMTTEIWRSMQYKGSEVMREVAWVIFDEVHYMRDRERGVVWEESIIMAPKNSRFVFLSATVPNAKEFADWVAKVHQQPCHIVYTDYRPTPLQHHIFPSRGKGLYLVVDEKGKFHEETFQKALNALVPASEGEKKSENGKWLKGLVTGGTGEESDIFKIVKMLMWRQYDPVILFSFSKRECELLAMQMAKMDLNGDDEKVNVETIFWSAMDILSDDDKKLPQAIILFPWLRCLSSNLFSFKYAASAEKRNRRTPFWLASHFEGSHRDTLSRSKFDRILGSGTVRIVLLKMSRELKPFVQCLFATETFSIGLNMPAKTVVFTNVRKFDGDRFRWISSGEYIQMSGRAGRRGIDKRGICVLMVNEKLEPSTAKMMLKGTADCLNSAFHLSYNMILNQIRCEDGDPENLLRNSFYQFQSDRAIPNLEKQAKELEVEKDSIVIEEEDSLNDYYHLLLEHKKLKRKVRDIVFSPKYCLRFLQPGRLVRILPTKIDDENQTFSIEEQVTWGLIVNLEKTKGPSKDDDNKIEEANYTVDVLTRCVVSKDAVGNKSMQIVPLKDHGEPVVVSLPISLIDGLSSIRVVIAKDLLSLEVRQNTLKKISVVLSKFSEEGIPLLDPEEDMKVENNDYGKFVRRIEHLEGQLEKLEVARSPLVEQNLKALDTKRKLETKIKSINEMMRASSLAFKDELKARKRVLRRLGKQETLLSFITRGDIVELKGKVACEISSAEELTLTELIFNGVLKDANVEQMVALLSCFVWPEKLQDAPKPSEELDLLFIQLQETARRVAKIQLESNIREALTSLEKTDTFQDISAIVSIDVERFVDSFRPDIMETVYAWAKGSKFYEIMENTPQVFEGSLIRAIRRLEEILQQLIQAAKSIGETQLESKFEEAVSKIKRDIVFAASLYL
ncbi:hypothetical protein Syun_005402 [Stephania yunnanensis]|uniref:DExH-box ATP-dependent RNA helicase DExH9 n=1 Tax=Stephania yunnanensis TaxID=152371 RepID=A0AAP0Q293_9MAGN